MKQRRQYAKCYQDLAESCPSVENLKMYGDALMKIQEPGEAMVAYQKALDKDEANQVIMRLIGQAMSATHNYQAATDYYERVVNDFPENT